MNLEQQIADKLFEIFYLDTKKYGVQVDDGSYRYIEGTISPMLIQGSLEKEGSLLVYQELPVFRNSLIKWVCFDVDIAKGFLEEGDKYFLAVKDAALIVKRCLVDLHIPHLVEFSGNRGFHLWVLFDEPVDKSIGYQLVNLVLNKVKSNLPTGINIDLFPQTPARTEKSKGVGKGVKLPLSKHRGSGFYAYLLKDLTAFTTAGKLKKLSSDDLEEQFNILDNIIYFKKDDQIKLFDLHSSELNEITDKTPFLQNFKVKSYILGDASLDDILDDLSQCDNIKTILDGYQKELNEKERNILVGLLINLRKQDDKDFGYNLLLELFSNITGYDEQKTKAKLEGLKYFHPVSCKVLGRCSHCKDDCGVKSPIELIPDVEISKAHNVNLLNFDQGYFEKVRNSLYGYSLRNDEVPLYPHLKKLQGIKGNEVERYVQDILKGGQISNFRKYRFDRKEKSKVRFLYNIDPLNNIVSTYFTFLLNSFFYLETSNNSYGYEFSKSLYKGNLYTNWFINWGKYTREIEKVLFNDCYAGYYLIKLDIRSFYDQVDLERLRIKLFEEAPESVKERLRDLPVEENEAYRHLINYLIDISIKTTGEEHRGLPQGPAYARYLAEIYLLGLDNLIENDFLVDPKREFYHRFVDDVFIFVENEERAKLLFNKVINWLSTNSLDLNREKTTVTKVSEFVKTGAYTRFKDDQKYDINYANKNKHILSESQINKALAGLRELAEDADFGVKDNLRFFYSQFKDDKVLRSLKKKLAPKIAFSTDGRGALYFLFYQDLFSSEKQVFLELSKSVEKMQGLALTHYLHALLMYIEDESFASFLPLFVATCLQMLTLTPADKLLLTSLILKYDMEIPASIDNDVVLEACDQPDLKLSDRMWPMFRETLQQIDNPKSYFNEVERIIDSHHFELEFLKGFADHVFIRFTEWKDTKVEEVLFDEASLVKYYHIISFLTLFGKPGLEGDIWEMLLNRSVQLGYFQYKEEHLWVDKISSFRLEEYTTAFYTLLFSDKGTGQLSKIRCPNNFLEHYRNILTIVMYASDKSENQIDFKTKLEEKVDDSEMSNLQRWVANEYSTLYPANSKIFLRNISLNGLIVLKCGKEFYVKNVNNINLTTKYKYIDNHTNESDEKVYQVVDHTLLSESFATLNSLSGVLNKLNQVFLDHKKFKESYGAYPLLYTGYEIVKNNAPAVPYFSDFVKVVDYDGNIVEWNTRNYFAVMFNFLSSVTWIHNPQINPQNTLFNFGIKQIRERFFPKSVNIGDESFEFKFLNYFCKECPNFDNIHDFQYLWSKALYLYLEEERSLDIVKDFFKIHLDHYNEFNIDVFWGAESTMYASKKHLLDFRNTLEQSIRSFQSQVADFNPEFDFVEKLLDKLFLAVDESEVEQAEFKCMPLIIKREPNYKNGSGDVEQYFLGEKLVKSVNVFSDTSGEFEEVSADELTILKEDKFLFAKIDRDEAFLLTVPNYLAKCYERVVIRKGLAERYISDPQGNIMLKDQFENPSVAQAGKSIYRLNETEKLVDKLVSHSGKNKEDVISRLTFWLAMFNEDLFLSVPDFKDKARVEGFIDSVHNCILKVLNAHSVIDDIDTVNFSEEITKLHSNNELIIALKHPGRDQNGLNQILTTWGNQRSVDFEKSFSQLCASTFTSEQIVIVSDIFISGQQTGKALKHYFSLIDSQDDQARHKKNEEKEKYFAFFDKAEQENLRKNIHALKSIVFMAPFISEKFECEIITKLKALGIKATVVCKPFGGFRPGNECFFRDCSLLNRGEHDLFQKIFFNRALMNNIFEFNEKAWDSHMNAINENLDFNIVLRPKSLPAKHFKPFAWKVINGQPLLKYRKNWGIS